MESRNSTLLGVKAQLFYSKMHEQIVNTLANPTWGTTFISFLILYDKIHWFLFNIRILRWKSHEKFGIFVVQQLPNSADAPSVEHERSEAVSCGRQIWTDCQWASLVATPASSNILPFPFARNPMRSGVPSKLILVGVFCASAQGSFSSVVRHRSHAFVHSKA